MRRLWYVVIPSWKMFSPLARWYILWHAGTYQHKNEKLEQMARIPRWHRCHAWYVIYQTCFFLWNHFLVVKDYKLLQSTSHLLRVPLTQEYATIIFWSISFFLRYKKKKIMQALLESNLIWTMFQINLILKKCMRKKSNGTSWI